MDLPELDVELTYAVVAMVWDDVKRGEELQTLRNLVRCEREKESCRAEQGS